MSYFPRRYFIFFSKNVEEHIKRLEGVFQRLEKHNLKLKHKCEFFMTEFKYLGHIVSEQGIRTDPDKTEALKTWTVLDIIKKLRSFLGFTGYYRRFVKDYSKILKPLNDLLVGHPIAKSAKRRKKRDKVPWVWGPSQQSAHYNARAGDLDDRLHAHCQTADFNMKFCHHYGFWDEQMYLSSDGVHLVNPRVDRRPMQKYLRSIRSAVLHFAGQLQ